LHTNVNLGESDDVGLHVMIAEDGIEMDCQTGTEGNLKL